MKVRLWHATVGGGLFGLLVGIALQLAIEIRQERPLQRLIEEFAPCSPPNAISIQKPEAIPVAICVLFAGLGSFVYVIWSRLKFMRTGFCNANPDWSGFAIPLNAEQHTQTNSLRYKYE